LRRRRGTEKKKRKRGKGRGMIDKKGGKKEEEGEESVGED
jgi:hypothetical protein